MKNDPEVAVIGAGPYGLSIAAHLRAQGIAFRIFGNPMESWRAHMPAGMLLKSEGFASDLCDPHREFTLRNFCSRRGLPYADVGTPVPLETLVAYGLDFQEQLVPNLENRMVAALDFAPGGFQLRLNDGETLHASRVILAAGHRYFSYVPQCFGDLPKEFVSHSSQHHDLSQFKNRDVTVVGGGASAMDLAVLLQEAGAQVRLLVRQPSVKFVSKPGPRTLWYRLRYPMTGIGGGWKNKLFADVPRLFRFLPQDLRSQIVKTHLGPAGGWFLQERLASRVPLLAGHETRHAEIRNRRVALQVNGPSGSSELVTDHVIAATGYQVNFHRLSFLSARLRSSLLSIGTVPILSPDFQSSVPGLYFVGLAAALWFGPVMRFMFGAGYTARCLSKHLAHAATAPSRAQLKQLVTRAGL